MNNSLGKALERRSVKARDSSAPASSPSRSERPTTKEVVNGKRRRGARDIVHQTVRLRREDWQRMKELSISEGLSSQEQFMRGLELLFKQYGLAPPQSPSTATSS